MSWYTLQLLRFIVAIVEYVLSNGQIGISRITIRNICLVVAEIALLHQVILIRGRRRVSHQPNSNCKRDNQYNNGDA